MKWDEAIPEIVKINKERRQESPSSSNVLLSVEVAYDITKAKEMLQIAADYIRKFSPDGMVHYDEADCDGYCVADDCEIAAASLKDR